MVDLMVSQNRTTNAAASYYRSYARHALWSTLFQNMILPSIRGVERARIDIMLLPIVNECKFIISDHRMEYQVDNKQCYLYCVSKQLRRKSPKQGVQTSNGVGAITIVDDIRSIQFLTALKNPGYSTTS